MKNTILFMLSFICVNAFSQGVFTNQTNEAIEKVIRDYPHQFENIRGVRLETPDGRVGYASSIAIPGAVSCIVIKSDLNGSETPRYAWKAELFQTSAFAEARSRYRQLYNQIGNSIIKMDHSKPFILNGRYENPVEQKKIHAITFNMLPSLAEVQHLKVELQMLREGNMWKINLIVHDAGHTDAAAIF